MGEYQHLSDSELFVIQQSHEILCKLPMYILDGDIYVCVCVYIYIYIYICISILKNNSIKSTISTHLQFYSAILTFYLIKRNFYLGDSDTSS